MLATLGAADQGLEPQYHPPEGCVLPLDESAISYNLDILPQNSGKTIDNVALLEYNYLYERKTHSIQTQKSYYRRY